MEGKKNNIFLSPRFLSVVPWKKKGAVPDPQTLARYVTSREKKKKKKNVIGVTQRAGTVRTHTPAKKEVKGGKD